MVPISECNWRLIRTYWEPGDGTLRSMSMTVWTLKGEGVKGWISRGHASSLSFPISCLLRALPCLLVPPATSTSPISRVYGWQRGEALCASSRLTSYLFAFQSSPSSVTSLWQSYQETQKEGDPNTLISIKSPTGTFYPHLQKHRENLYFQPVPIPKTGCSIFSHTC